MTDQTASASDQITDEEAIRKAALDYVEGWYDGDAQRMGRCLHPNLVKRAIKRDAPSGNMYLNYLTREAMVVATASGGGSHVPQDERTYTIDILDLHGEIASVRAVSPDWIDYLHLAKLDGRWLIINVLYTAKQSGR